MVRPWATPGPTPARPTWPNPPSQPPSPNRPKAKLKPTMTHSTAISPMAKKFCMSMPSRFLARTMPP